MSKGDQYMNKRVLTLLSLTFLWFLSGCYETTSWSPDGNWIAYVSARSGHSQVWISNREGTQHIKLTRLPESRIPGFAVWLPAGKQILFVERDTKQDEKYFLKIVDINKKTIQLIAELREEDFLTSFASLNVARSQDKVFFTKNGKVYVYHTENNKKDEIFSKADALTHLYVASTSGNSVLMGVENQDEDREEMQILSVVQRTTSRLAVTMNESPEFCNFVPNEEKVFCVVSNQNNKKPFSKGITFYQDGTKENEASIPMEIQTDATVWTGRSTLRFLKDHLMMDLDINTGGVEAVKEILPDESWHISSFSPDGKKAAFVLLLNENTGGLFAEASGYYVPVIYDIHTDEIQYLADSGENQFLYCESLTSHREAVSCFRSFVKKYPFLTDLKKEARFLIKEYKKI